MSMFPAWASDLFADTFLTDTVTIQRVTMGQNATNGGRERTVTHSETVRAKVESIDPTSAGAERVLAQIERGTMAYHVSLAKTQAVDSSDQIVYKGKTMEILSVDDTDTNLLMKDVICVERRS